MAGIDETKITTYKKVLLLGIISPPIAMFSLKADGLLSTISGIITAIVVIYALYLVFWIGASICDEEYVRKYPNKELKINVPFSKAEKEIASVVFGSLILTLLLGLFVGGIVMWLLRQL